MIRLHLFRATLLAGLVGTTAFMIGCGGGSGTTSQATNSNATNASPDTSATEAPQSAPVAANTSSGLVSQKNGTTWIDDIPVDVWYDNPLQVAAEQGTVAQPNPGTTVAANTPTTTTPMATSDPPPQEAAPSGGTDWKKIIPAEFLDAEVTTIRNRFNADLQTVGAYNSSYLALPPHIAMLSVLGHVAKDHPEEIRWKENAHYIKHIAGQMIAEPLRRGPSSQRPLKLQFENILVVLNGSTPTAVEVPDNESIAELAEMGNLMKRLESAEKNLRVNGGTEDAMKSNAKVIQQEAAILGAATQILLDEGYGFEGDEGFEKFVKNMVDATLEIREHVKNEDFGKFELAVSKVTQACQQCHSEYRG